MKALIHNISWEESVTGAEHRLAIAKIVLAQVLDLCWQLRSTKQAPPWEKEPHTRSTNRQKMSLAGAISEVMKTVKVVSAKSKTAPENEWRSADNQNYEKTNKEYDRRLWMIVPHLKANKHDSHTKESLTDGIMMSKVCSNHTRLKMSSLNSCQATEQFQLTGLIKTRPNAKLTNSCLLLAPRKYNGFWRCGGSATGFV